MATTDTDEKLNPGQQHADEQFDKIASGYDQTADSSTEDANVKRAKELLDKENHTDKSTNDQSALGDQEKSSAPNGGGWEQNVKGKPSNVSFLRRMAGNKKVLGGAGLTGIGLLIAMAFVSLLPLKLEMMIKNVTQIASSVPSYATEQRLEYLITRALASRMLGLAHNADASLVFCKGGAIACSLFATFSNEYFEKKLGIELNIDAKGRVGLGGRASSWEVKPVISKGATVMNEESVKALTFTLENNSDMKALIRQEVHSKTKSYQIITRYLARKLLMKKYGVTNWRGPKKIEAAVNRFNEAKANLKAGIIKNTLAKISPRMAIYLTCLQGSVATCEKLREGIDATKNAVPVAEAAEPVQSPEESGLSEGDPGYDDAKADYERYQASQQAVEKITEGIAQETTEEIAEDAAKDGIKSFISKRALAVAGGGLAAAGIADLVFKAVGSIDNGALDEISYDMTSQTYTGLSSYLKTVNDSMKINDIDIETLEAAFQLFEGVESSALYQAESGLAVDTSKGLVTECSGPNGPEKTRLKPGQLLCDDQKLVRDYDNALKGNPAWLALAATANTWNKSVGVAFDAVSSVTDAVFKIIPGFDLAMKNIGTAAQPFMDWVIGLAFDPPLVGDEATSSQNYAALSGGIRESQNAVMKYGVDEDGNAMGGGGRVLSNEEIGAIVSEQEKYQQQDYKNRPMIAKLFDATLTGSFANRMLAYMPTSIAGFVGLPTQSFSSLLSGNLVGASTTNIDTINPFNLPIYGFSLSELQTEPKQFTESYCKVLAQNREDSYKRYRSISSIGVYKTSDPCALEKMVVGAALYDAGVYNNTYSLKRVNNVD